MKLENTFQGLDAPYSIIKIKKNTFQKKNHKVYKLQVSIFKTKMDPQKSYKWVIKTKGEVVGS